MALCSLQFRVLDLLYDDFLLSLWSPFGVVLELKPASILLSPSKVTSPDKASSTMELQLVQDPLGIFQSSNVAGSEFYLTNSSFTDLPALLLVYAEPPSIHFPLCCNFVFIFVAIAGPVKIRQSSSFYGYTVWSQINGSVLEIPSATSSRKSFVGSVSILIVVSKAESRQIRHRWNDRYNVLYLSDYAMVMEVCKGFILCHWMGCCERQVLHCEATYSHFSLAMVRAFTVLCSFIRQFPRCRRLFVGEISILEVTQIFVVAVPMPLLMVLGSFSPCRTLLFRHVIVGVLEFTWESFQVTLFTALCSFYSCYAGLIFSYHVVSYESRLGSTIFVCYDIFVLAHVSFLEVDVDRFGHFHCVPILPCIEVFTRFVLVVTNFTGLIPSLFYSFMELGISLTSPCRKIVLFAGNIRRLFALKVVFTTYEVGACSRMLYSESQPLARRSKFEVTVDKINVLLSVVVDVNRFNCLPILVYFLCIAICIVFLCVGKVGDFISFV